MKQLNKLAILLAPLAFVNNAHAIKASEIINSSFNFFGSSINLIQLFFYFLALLFALFFLLTLKGLGDEQNRNATPKRAAILFIATIVAYFIPAFISSGGEELGIQDNSIGKKLNQDQRGNANVWE